MKIHSCVTYVKGVVGGLNATKFRHSFRNGCRKIALLKNFKFATSKESNFHSFRATGLTLVSKEAEFCDLQSYRDFFFPIFGILTKITPFDISVSKAKKKTFFRTKM